MKPNILIRYKQNLLLLICFSIASLLQAQTKSFSVEVSRDTVLLGNQIKAVFTLKNCDGKFEAPDFKDFNILSGPNTSTSMYSVNGETTSSSTYTYFLKPKKIGEFFIANAYLINKGDESKNMETSPMKIVVLDNPEGIIQEDEEDAQGLNQMFFSFPNNDFFGKGELPKQEKQDPKKQTRKLKRI